MRHAFLTCLWHRERLAREVLRNTIVCAPAESVFLAVASREEDAAVARDEGWTVVMHENIPLSAKWQAGLDSLRREDVESVTILGSDDVLSARAISGLLGALEHGATFAAPLGCYVWRPADERLVLWNGYRGAREGEPIGTGRTFSRALLDALDWKVWTEPANSGLDRMAWERLGALQRKAEGFVRCVLLNAARTPILDVKTDPAFDMGSFDVSASEGGAAPEDAFAMFETATLAAIRELADPVAATPRFDPVEAPRLAACLIVKDEAACLPRCLASLVGVVDELVAVVDARTTDRTREILRAAGARWAELDWQGFSAARNHGLEMTRAPWRLVIDADEVLEHGDAVRSATATREPTDETNALAVRVSSVVGSGAAALSRSAIRVIGPDVRYRYRRHNETVGVRGALAVPGALIRTSYHGRLAAKAEGTIRDLLAEWEEEKGQHAAAYLAHTYRGVADYESSIRWANESIGIDAMNQYGVMSWLDLVHATQAARGFEAGDEVLRRATALHPGCADLWHSWLATVAFRWAQAASDPGPYQWLPQVSTPHMALLLPGLVEALRLPLAQTVAEAPAAG